MWPFKKTPIDKLDFVIAGAQKCGTTALRHYLREHPEISLAEKELHFFDEDERFDGSVDYGELHKHFSPKGRQRIAGECTPIYIYWRPVLERIRNCNPEVKMIVILRDPVMRAFSHWNMEFSRKYETLDFLDAIKAEPRRAAEAAPMQLRRHSYVDRGLYSGQITRALQTFPHEHIKFLKYENFRVDPQKTMNEVTEFLGLERLEVVRRERKNVFPYRRKLADSERQFVRNLFAEDIPKVEQLLGWDCSDWKN